MYCYLEFKLRYLKNLKLFSVRVKELFEPTVFRKKGDGFLLFLEAFSWETDLWLTLGDFTVKKCKIGRRNLYLTKNRSSRNGILCAADNHNNMCHLCAKGFLDSNLINPFLSVHIPYVQSEGILPQIRLLQWRAYIFRNTQCFSTKLGRNMVNALFCHKTLKY